MKLLEVDRIRLKGLLSQKQRHVASALGIHANTLSLKLNGEARFYLDELNQIARYLKCDTMNFLREVIVDGSAVPL